MVGPASSSAGGTRVVLPEPGSATTTTERRARSFDRISSIAASIGSGSSTDRYGGWRLTRRRVGAATQSSGARGDADGAGYACTTEAAVPVGILREVLLVVV